MKTETKKRIARFGSYCIFALMILLFKQWGIEEKVLWSNWAMMVAIYGLSTYENTL